MREETNPRAFLNIKSETPDKMEVWCKLRGTREIAEYLMIIGILSMLGVFFFSVHNPGVRPWIFLGIAIFLFGYFLFRRAPRPYITFFRNKLDATITFDDRSYPMNLDENPFEARFWQSRSALSSAHYYIRIHGKILGRSSVDIYTTTNSLKKNIYAAAVLDAYRHGSELVDRRYLDAVRTPKDSWKRALIIAAASIAVAGLLLLLSFLIYP